MLAQHLGAGLGDERQVGEVDPTLGVRLLVLPAELRNAGVVYLEEARHVRRDTARHDHVIRGDLADLRERLDAVARPRLDDGMLQRAGGSPRSGGAGRWGLPTRGCGRCSWGRGGGDGRRGGRGRNRAHGRGHGGSRRDRSTLDKLQDVLLRHPARESGPRDGRDIEVVLGRDLTHEGCGAPA